MRVLAVSDIHTDYKENMAWLERHCAAVGLSHDAIIVAGDVSDDLAVFRRTFELLTGTYPHVFFTVGNHELWVRRGDRDKYDSLGKMRALLDICEDLGVRTAPAKINGVWIVPIFSWYHASWDREPDVPGALPIERVMMDFHACAWPSIPGLRASGDDSLARHFDSLNDLHFSDALQRITKERLEAKEATEGERSATVVPPVVVSFSHFLPLQDLLPEKRWLYYPNLAKACGSDYLANRVKDLAPNCHVYGHTHFTQDMVIDGIRFVQWPLGYPKEHARRRITGEWEPIVLWDAAEGSSEQRSSYWGDFYRKNERKPHIVTPAPYVKG